jgi:predicted phosphoribosyltransferase
LAEIGRFYDRADAGQQLADHLLEFANRDDVTVLALPRGGLPVAKEVSARLGTPIDVLIVRKLGVPGHPELAMGAIATGGLLVVSDDLIRDLGIPRAIVEQVAARERAELERREIMYHGGRQPLAIRDRTVILVDDGLATGASMRAAILAARQRRPATVVVAAPVGASESCEDLRQVADRVVCPLTPEPFSAVGLWYEDFSQVTDEEVRRLLASIY